jgi:hypothetical protein
MKKKETMTNNDVQNTTSTIKYDQHEPHQLSGVISDAPEGLAVLDLSLSWYVDCYIYL